MRLTVYASSSQLPDPRFRAVAEQLGRRMAERGDELVYGGTAVGSMRAVSDAVRAAGGRVTGVVPILLQDRGLADDGCDELVVTDGMSGRKQVMIERAEAFVALPGGLGTLEELFEVLTLKQLGYHDKPIVLLDVDGFWEPLLHLFEHLFTLGFVRPEYAALYRVVDEVEVLFEYLDGYQPAVTPAKPV